MERKLLLSLQLSLFLTLGNAQEDALPVSTVYATQGNVARRQSLEEAEMQAAVLAARQDKALKAAMATYSQPQQVITTPAQFLAANPPRVPVAAGGEGDLSGFIVKKNDEVPEFDPVSGANDTAVPPLQNPPVQNGAPAKVGFFEKFKAMNRRKVTGNPENPYAAEQPAPPESVANMGEAVAGNPVKKEAFGGLFKRGKSRPSTAHSVEEVGAPPVTPVPDGLLVGTGTTVSGPANVTAPSVPNAQTMPQPETSIFIPRQTGTLSGELASLKSTTDADVGGVLVSIREGTQVGILSERGGIATIQLPDQRIGTIKSNLLAR